MGRFAPLIDSLARDCHYVMGVTRNDKDSHLGEAKEDQDYLRRVAHIREEGAILEIKRCWRTTIGRRMHFHQDIGK